VSGYEVFITKDPNLLDPNSVPVPALTPVYAGAGTSTEVVSGLDFLTQYYWRVDTIADDATRYVGPRFVFTTAPAIPFFSAIPFSAVFADETAVLTATAQALRRWPVRSSGLRPATPQSK
jgi:hypothetical protein